MNNANEKPNGTTLSLPFELAFEDLYQREGLVKLDGIFLQGLRASGEEGTALHDRLIAARQNPLVLTAKQQSELIIALAPYLEDFLGHLFGIEPELRELQARHSELAPLLSVKRRFVQRKALTGYTQEKASAIDGFAVEAELEALIEEPLTERSFANHVARWLEAEADHATHLQLAAQYAT